MIPAYHLTRPERSIMVAVSGAILPRWEQRLEWMIREEKRNHSRNFEKEFSPRKKEELAKDFESLAYKDHEIELNVMSIKLTTDIYLAKRLALCNEGADGGLFLAMNLEEKEARDLKRQYQSQESFYLPKRLSLDYLKEIHLSPRAKEKKGWEIKQAFSKYNPAYFVIT